MEYNQENSYFRASCLSHDVVDIFNMVADCALEPRSVVAASVNINNDSHVKYIRLHKIKLKELIHWLNNLITEKK
jgi:hypothetical protein